MNKMNNLLKSLRIGILMLGASCSEKTQPQFPERPAISNPITFNLLEYRVKRGDTLTDVTNDLLKEETLGYGRGRRINFGNMFELEFNSDDYHGHASPTRLLCEINGFEEACKSHYFEDVKLDIGQRLAIPDLNDDNKIGGKSSKHVGKLEVVIKSPSDLTADQIDAQRITYGAGHPLIGGVEYKKK